jgi:hypothetical protein
MKILLDTTYDVSSLKLMNIILKIFNINDKIIIVNKNDNFDYIISSFSDKKITMNDKKYIYWSGEPYPCKIKNNNFIQFNTIENISNSIYLPYVFDSPYWTKNVRKFNNKNRQLFLAYCNSKVHQHREDIYNKFVEKTKNTDKICNALGKCYGKYRNTHKKINGHWSDLKLIEEYSKYNFILAIENCDKPGYVTEKIMNAYASGGIPIYWGNKKVKELFNPKSFIYMNDFKNIDECLNYIFNMMNKDIVNMMNEPIYNENDKILNIHKYNTDNFDINSLDFNNDFYNNIKQNIEDFFI